jgi:hypothetical protein
MPGRPAIMFHTLLYTSALNKPALREAGLGHRQPSDLG